MALGGSKNQTRLDFQTLMTSWAIGGGSMLQARCAIPENEDLLFCLENIYIYIVEDTYDSFSPSELLYYHSDRQ